MEFEKPLKVSETGIPGMVVLDLPVHGDNRGWFKENWQRAKMTALGVPDLRVVQNNVSYNATRGVTRGMHAEPWDKFISIAVGKVFGAWVDLREGPSFGRVYTTILDPTKAIFVPRGVANGFQTLVDGTVYTYLVDAHWSLAQKLSYTFVNLADPALKIAWPIPLDQCELSDADRRHPMLSDVIPMMPKRVLVTGAHGQLGMALHQYASKRGLTYWQFTDRDTFDISKQGDYEQFDWDSYSTIVNTGAYTSVDAAETDEGRVAAWRANAIGPMLLARVAREHGLTLVHISSDYVFDGLHDPHHEDEPLTPLSVYGQSKAAGDVAVMGAGHYYILRASWVLGEGHNFVDTMRKLATRILDHSDTLNHIEVVDDQIGRPTFTDELTLAIVHLLDSRALYGVYNCTASGPETSWCDIARRVFEHMGVNPSAVNPVSTRDYYRNVDGPVAPRPRYSTLDLTRIMQTDYRPRDWRDSLDIFLS